MNSARHFSLQQLVGEVMRKLHLIAVLSTCLLAAFVVSAQASGGHEPGPGFTNSSLEGAYYIPCACEGNETSTGGSIHSAGMGKIVFDGKGGATITQQNLYTEIGNQITRVVKDGVPLAQFSGSYQVDSEGYGVLFDGAFPPKESAFTPSFMVTKANGKNVTEIYLILPQNFIDFTPEPKHLIHVTAARR
jgi:hypothetical protein